jgi:hypothetical protein
MNIRGIGDLENNRYNQGNSNRQGMPLLTSNFTSSNPRKESFFFFLRSICCPLSTWKSFIAIIAMINVLIYIVTLCFGISEATKNNPSFLAPLGSTIDWGTLVRKELIFIFGSLFVDKLIFSLFNFFFNFLFFYTF